jgi:hypothetical protein
MCMLYIVSTVSPVTLLRLHEMDSFVVALKKYFYSMQSAGWHPPFCPLLRSIDWSDSLQSVCEEREGGRL